MLALLYDIHGNLPALEAVIADAERQGASSYILGGDYTAFGAWPSATLARLDELPAARWIRGNWERWQVALRRAPDNAVVQSAGIFANEQIGWDRVVALGRLPVSVERDGILFCHASPNSDIKAVGPDGDGDAHLLTDVNASRIVVGHLHIQFERRSDIHGIGVLAPGSVGLPWDGDRCASYALLDEHGVARSRRVEYDVERSIAALERIDEPWAPVTAQRLRLAAFDV